MKYTIKYTTKNHTKIIKFDRVNIFSNISDGDKSDNLSSVEEEDDDKFPADEFPLSPSNPSTIPFTIILGILFTIKKAIKKKRQNKKKDSYLLYNLMSYKKKG